MWYAKPLLGYLRDSTEAISNATEIKNYLTSLGWSLNAICGMLGNLGSESGYNPWRWENDWKPEVGALAILSKQEAYTYEGTDHGYGLYAFTPANKYCNTTSETYTGYAPNFSDEAGNPSDGQAQTYWVHVHPDQFYPAYYSWYPTWTDFSNYKTSTENCQTLADIWMCNWEKPAYQNALNSRADRMNEAQYWWDYFEGGPTPPPPPPTPPKPLRLKKFKWWMYMSRPMPF